MNSIGLNQAVRRLKKYLPRTVEETLCDCGFTLTYIGEGAFRKVYTVEGTDSVLKVPFRSRTSLEHARQEYNVLIRLREKEYKAIHRFLPEVYYFEQKTGVSLAQRYDPVARVNLKEVRAMYREIRAVVGLAPNLDEHIGNVGFDAWNNFRLLDLGLIKVGLLGRD